MQHQGFLPQQEETFVLAIKTLMSAIGSSQAVFLISADGNAETACSLRASRCIRAFIEHWPSALSPCHAMSLDLPDGGAEITRKNEPPFLCQRLVITALQSALYDIAGADPILMQKFIPIHAKLALVFHQSAYLFVTSAMPTCTKFDVHHGSIGREKKSFRVQINRQAEKYR